MSPSIPRRLGVTLDTLRPGDVTVGKYSGPGFYFLRVIDGDTEHLGTSATLADALMRACEAVESGGRVWLLQRDGSYLPHKCRRGRLVRLLRQGES